MTGRQIKAKRWFQAIGIVALVSVPVFLFQNCTKSGFKSDGATLDDALNESAAVSVDPVFAKLPFPYDVSVNQIAHMSCALNVSSTEVSTPYFSWAVGAYDNPADVPTGNGFKDFKISQTAGLQMNSDFITQFQTITKNYNPEVIPGKFKSLLQTHPTVNGVQLQLSLRKRNAVRTDLMKLLTGGGEVAGDSPAKMILEPLSSDSVAGYFSTHPKSLVHEIPGITGSNNRYLDARLNIPSAYGAQNANLISNYDQSYLTVGFATGQADLVDSLTTTSLASPSTLDTDKTKAYGVGFRPYFGVVNMHQGTDQYPSVDALTGLQEFNLKTGNQVNDGSSWKCDYKFKIVLNKDRQNTFYRKDHFLKILNTTTNQYECPGTEYTSGTLCASPINPDFGLPAVDFIAAGSTQATVNLGCPINRAPVTASLTNRICAERYTVLCPSEPYYSPGNNVPPYMREDGLYNSKYPERAALFHALRRFLPADKWDINVSRRCIVPKMDDNVCYASGGSAPVVYDDTFFKGIVNQIQSNGSYRSPASSVDLSLDANINMGRYLGCGVSGQYPCSAYLTLCLRTKP
jgi:hypothetical protein